MRSLNIQEYIYFYNFCTRDYRVLRCGGLISTLGIVYNGTCTENSKGEKKHTLKDPTIPCPLFQVSKAEGLLKDLAVRIHNLSFTLKVCGSRSVLGLWGCCIGEKTTYQP